MRKLAVTSFGLSDGDLIGMCKIARLICGWETAQTRSIEVNKMDAELEVRGQPKAVLANDYIAMKRAFEKQYWTLCDEKTPAKSYLERKLESLETREVRPEKLGDVINYREDDSMELKPVWDSSRSLKAMKTACSVPLPRVSEELPSRITLLGTAWVMAAMHQTSNPLLKDLRPHIFTEYCDYQMQKKGDGKGKGKGKLPGCAPYTRDGQKVCFDFNTKDMVCRRGRGCTFAHVCGRCFKVGTPMYSCKWA